MRRRRIGSWTIWNVRWRTEHPVQSAVYAGAATFVGGLAIFDGDLRPAIAGLIITGVGAWLLWRPGGPMARRWTERIAQQEFEDARGPIDWGPPSVPPTGNTD